MVRLAISGAPPLRRPQVQPRSQALRVAGREPLNMSPIQWSSFVEGLVYRQVREVIRQLNDVCQSVGTPATREGLCAATVSVMKCESEAARDPAATRGAAPADQEKSSGRLAYSIEGANKGYRDEHPQTAAMRELPSGDPVRMAAWQVQARSTLRTRQFDEATLEDSISVYRAQRNPWQLINPDPTPPAPELREALAEARARISPLTTRPERGPLEG